MLRFVNNGTNVLKFRDYANRACGEAVKVAWGGKEGGGKVLMWLSVWLLLENLIVFVMLIQRALLYVMVMLFLFVYIIKHIKYDFDV